ncbi:MAG TPA: phosphatase PAP2 family protein [Candidatus Kapabacteria bacterium]|nr:phosphatase PAP2 family protein [Candidatus Kapabacteria bacterium]
MKKMIIICQLLLITSLTASNYNLIPESKDYIYTDSNLFIATDNYKYNISDINIIDKTFMNGYNPNYALLSDALLMANIVSPTIINYSQFTNSWELPLAYGETIATSFALTYIVKYLVERPRPFNYYKNTPENLLNNYDSQLSFFSGHSSISFSAAVFNSLIYEKYNPYSRYKGLIWSVSLLSATTTATLRVLAGKHFLSDVIIGAIVGSLISYGIIELNSLEVKDNKPHNIQLIQFKYSIK